MAKKVKGLPKRVSNKNKQARHARSYGRVAERKLRRMLRSNGPAFALKNGSAGDLVRLAREQTKVGALARTALGR